MTTQQANIADSKLSKFRQLERARAEAYSALEIFKDETFTGNTRESRRIQSLHIEFTTTRGGAESKEIYANGLFIEAYAFGSYIKTAIQERIKLITEEMDKI